MDSISVDLPAIQRMETEFEKAKSELAIIAGLVDEEDKKGRGYNFHGSPSERVRHAFAVLQNRHEQIIGGSKAFNQDLIVYLRAIGLVAEMVMGAGTHAEKNARMRGMIEQIETAIQKLRQHDMEFNDHHYWNAPDVWRSDYPVRMYMERAHNAEKHAEELQKEIARLKGEPFEPAQMQNGGNDELQF